MTVAAPGLGAPPDLATAIAERDEALLRLEQMGKRLSRLMLDVRTLFDLPRQLQTMGGPEDILRLLVYTISGQFLVEDVAAYWRSGHEKQFSLLARVALVEPAPPDNIVVDELWAAHAGVKPQALRDIPAGTFSAVPSATTYVVPLWQDGSLSGLLFLADQLTSGALSAQDLSLLQALAEQSVLAMDNVRLLQETQRQQRELAVRNEALALAYSRLQQLDELKGEIIGRTLHEFNTPLTTILGYVQLVRGREQDVLSDRMSRILGIIEENAGRIAESVRAIADAAYLEEGMADRGPARTPVVVADLVAEVVNRFQMIASSRHLTLDLVQQPPFGVLAVDVRQIEQIVGELLQNAIRFTEDGGAIRVSTSPWRPGQTDWTLAVADTGVGIAAAHHQRIFERFESARDVRLHSSGKYEFASGGLGLGLWVVRKIVENHGGTVGVTSAPGRGSTFTVTIPGLQPPPGFTPPAGLEIGPGE
ncbi:MAG: hypothetical protein HYV63_04115 [Candidatus Schekmanbacteria bacterium]|nr:hypothetical protein [Candidatus Schekmanbacteria bacterium]